MAAALLAENAFFNRERYNRCLAFRCEYPSHVPVSTDHLPRRPRRVASKGVRAKRSVGWPQTSHLQIASLYIGL